MVQEPYFLTLLVRRLDEESRPPLRAAVGDLDHGRETIERLILNLRLSPAQVRISGGIPL